MITGFRSATPTIFQALKDLPELYEHFWAHGTIGRESMPKNANPMFASSMPDTFTLHYGTDPLLGFHLATAYTPVTPNSPLHPGLSSLSSRRKVVNAAQSQFRAWSAAFRRYATSKLVLRFVVSDALTFCHDLQHQTLSGDEEASDKEATNAPLTFDIIDTSNLMDHIGALNVLSATSPVLTRKPWSSMYTEVLVKKDDTQQALMDRLLCGHAPTVALLLRLIPADYWMNITTTPDYESFLDTFLKITIRNLSPDEKGQMRSRIIWKSVAPVADADSAAVTPLIHVNEQDLARTLHQIYRNMFEHENIVKLFSNTSLNTQRKALHQHYHRGSFV